ncbi:response regulator transcription factor [Trinickia caryophylli]|uniref:Two component transcriptional regulator, LuxR family n=1 Tax=Trinickia caryophylli TaxID=28094 RepID=A0A1X7FIK5_TRICW|nr:response regulator transcription factor [Trinickia caryophylli]PMS13211.1 DNA-binding response regulator [Trinickia caryophylli]TRX19260.1 response regulator transcription factor [Trinickia caryophylli]WQE13436.1 response regulator transcription factor [Trinickia caryophylli]SMF52849.1 two component transcriptional regulator, LuxR family [Trinickia caryophylli]GLU34040.1 DNA-binding response regulator [Trinickia caryophylli]
MSIALSGCRILLADDHAMVRTGFRLLLEGAGATVVGEAESGEEALRQYAELAPAVLVMDVSMPGIGGLAALERLRARCPEARVLMLSARQDAMIPVRALKAGAIGYLSKRCLPQALIQAVHQVAQGLRYLDPELAQEVALAQISGAAHPAQALTEKEFTIFLQLAQGRTVNDVAKDFHLSGSTVGTHLYHIKQKLNAGNAAELAVIAMRAGLLDL